MKTATQLLDEYISKHELDLHCKSADDLNYVRLTTIKSVKFKLYVGCYWWHVFITSFKQTIKVKPKL